MSTDVKHFVPEIAERLDYATVDIYLLQKEVITASEFDSFQKALQNGTSTNGDLIRKLLPRILEKPREFYRALRQHIQDNHNVHAGNKELFKKLPENFGKKGFLQSTIGKFKLKSKSSISTIPENPASSSDTDKNLDQIIASSYEDVCVSTDEEESEYEMQYPSGPKNRKHKFPSTQSLYTPRKKTNSHSMTRQLSEISPCSQRSTLPRTMSQQHLVCHTRKRSASVNEDQLSYNMKPQSSSELNQPNNVSQELIAWTPVPKPRSIKPLSQATENSVKHQNSQSDLPTDEASHKADYAKLQQQLDSIKSSNDAKSQALKKSLNESINQLQQQFENSLTEKYTKLLSLENSLNESIAHLQQQLNGTENSLTEKKIKIQSLETSLNDSIAELQQQLDSTEGNKNIKFQAFENSLKESITHLQQQIDELQSGLSQVLEKNTDYNKKDKEDKMIIKKLQEDVIQMQKELKQYKSGYNQNGAETYKIQIEAEKQKAAEAQETLTQALAEVQGKSKKILALEKSQYELQLTVQKLEDDLMQSKIEHDSKIIEYNKEIQKHKNLSNIEKEKTIKAQEALKQVSDELQEKAKETLALRESQHELQLMVQQLKEQSKSDYDNKITEHTKEIQKYKKLCDAEKENTVKAQEALTKVTAELQEKANKILALEQSHHQLLGEKQNIETQLQDVLEQCDARIKKIEDSNKHLQVEKENTAKKENTTIREIQDKNTLLLQEKEYSEINIKRLQDENNVLKTAKSVLDSEQAVATKEREAVLQELAESKEQYHALEEHFNKVLTEKQNNEIVIQNLLNALEQSKSEKENHKHQVENLEKKLQQKEKFRELPLSTDQNYKSNNGPSLLPASVESSEDYLKTEGDQATKVEEHITPATTVKDQNSAEQIKDELTGSHIKLSIVGQFVTTPLKDPLTEVSKNNQSTVLIKKKTIMKDQSKSKETTVQDKFTETAEDVQLRETPAEDPQTEIPAEDQQTDIPAEDQQTETPADQQTVTPTKVQHTEIPAEDQQTETPDQQTVTPTKVQHAEKTMEHQQMETPAEDQETTTPAKDKSTETPAKDRQTETPAEDQHTEIPAKDRQTETPAEDQHTETPAEDQQTETPAEDQQTATPAEDQQKTIPAEDQQTATPAKDQPTETPAKDRQTETPAEDQHTEIPAKDRETETPAEDQQKTTPAEDQQTATPAKDQPTETPAKDRQTETPAEVQHTETPAEDQQTVTPTKVQHTEIPAEDQQTETPDQQTVTPTKVQHAEKPMEHQQMETPAEDQETTTPAKDQPTETPAKDRQTETPAEDQHTETPAKDRQTETPAKDQQLAEDQQTKAPAKDQPTETPAKEAPTENQQTKTPVKHQQTETPREDQHTERPEKDNHTETLVKDQLREIPADDQLKITPVKDQFTNSSTKDQLTETPAKENLTEDPTNNQLTENHNTEHNVKAYSMPKSSPSMPQACKISEEHSTEYVNTLFGVRRKSIRRKTIAQDEKKPTGSNVLDPQLQNAFARRQKKISDPNALEEFEEKVHKTKENTRASTKQNEDGKYLDRAELFKKLQKQQNKIT